MSEIIWWNRGLTQITETEWFRNGREIASNLVQRKGPYIEFVKSPVKHADDFLTFLNGIGANPLMRDAFNQVLFRGSPGGRLFLHQAQAIQEILSEQNRDVVISVPTATGKTEAFMIPVLDYCARAVDNDKEQGLKAIMVYPLKTLEVDQLNRMIKVLYHYNSNNDRPRKIQIAIWDGDTPERVSSEDGRDNEVVEGSPLRGLVCPKCGEKLYLGRDGVLRCHEGLQFHWIRATRQQIRREASRIDILVTNPESIDYMMISASPDVRALLNPTSQLKFVIFDEAHVWRGISGSHINLLIKRLRHFYRKSKPKMILVSATIGDLEAFATDILGGNCFQPIVFTPSEIPRPGASSFSTVPSCTFRDLCEVILRYQTAEVENLGKLRPNLSNAITMAERLELISSNPLDLTADGKLMLRYMSAPSRQPVDGVLDDAIHNLNSSIDFIDHWRSLLLQRLPEVFELAHLFPVKKSPVVFESSAILQEKIKTTDPTITDCQAMEVLATLLSFGRSANILVDKYHVFIKPLSELYWCPDHRLLSDQPICPHEECHRTPSTLRFCVRCNHPHVVVQETPNQMKASEDEAPIGLVPIESYLTNGGSGDFANTCIECGEELDYDWMNDPWVQYTTFTSYLISALCREGGAQKAIVFSDGRRSAEAISLRVVDLDYGLVAEQLYCQHLLRSNNLSANYPTIMFEVRKKLRRFYTDFMEESVNSKQSKDLINEFFLKTVAPKAYLSETRHLIDYSILSATDIVDTLHSSLDLMIAQEVFSIYAHRRAKFQNRKVKFNGLTQGGIRDRLSKRFASLEKDSPGTIQSRLPNIIKLLIDANLVVINHPENVRSEIESALSSIGDQENRQKAETEVIKMLRDERESLDASIGCSHTTEYEIASTLVSPDTDNFTLTIVRRNCLCYQCHSVYPADEEDISRCPRCGGKLHYGSRVGSIAPLGYLATEVDRGRPMDHWGKDILGVAMKNKDGEIPKVVTWVHRAGINTEIRGAIEEGFRRSNPEINIVSSTPTLELGIDIGSLDAVVQIGFPPALTNYVQRSGRTGRVRGKPSFVFTIMRNDHSVDMYYMDRMERYFSAFKPINIPDPKIYLPVQAPHVVTECCTYLSRLLNQDQYAKLYEVPPEGGLSHYSEEVQKRLGFIVKLATEATSKRDYSNDIKEHIIAVFGNLKAFEEVFASSGPLSIKQRAAESFGRLETTSHGSKKLDAGTQRRYARDNMYLGNWLSTMGLFASYRGIGGMPVPLVLEAKQQEIEIKTEDQIIKEAYPGQDNKTGAIFYVEGVKFAVAHATGGPKQLIEASICRNKKCTLPYRSYTSTLDNCPLCNQPFDKVKVFNVGEITPELTKRKYLTSPIIAALCSLKEERGSPINLHIGSLATKAQLGRFHNVVFTPAFYKSGTAHSEGTVMPSEAEIPSQVVENGGSDEMDFDKWIEQGSNVLKAPIGYEDFTEGLSITIDRKETEQRLPRGIKDLVVAAFSFVQAVKRSVAVVAQTEMQDFDVYWGLDEDTFTIYVLDGRSGGNGVARLIASDIEAPKSLFLDILKKTVQCPRKCHDFCDSCLLLERTSEELIRKRLLSRHTLGRLLGFSTEAANVED